MPNLPPNAKSFDERVRPDAAHEPVGIPPSIGPQIPKMDQLSAVKPADGQRLTRRALAKQRTRRQLLDAAKRLFNERGYEAATVREIAAAAGHSTGAVFASFADKAELFGEVILDDYDALFERLTAVDDDAATAEAALLQLFATAYAFHHDHLPLVRAAIGQCWLGQPEAERRVRGGIRKIQTQVDAVLRRGVERGELSADLDIRLTNELIWNSFMANYRHAVAESWDVGALESKLAAQLKILLAGWRAAA
jgi:AcrR family transcriptional regulator